MSHNRFFVVAVPAEGCPRPVVGAQHKTMDPLLYVGGECPDSSISVTSASLFAVSPCIVAR